MKFGTEIDDELSYSAFTSKIGVRHSSTLAPTTGQCWTYVCDNNCCRNASLILWVIPCSVDNMMFISLYWKCFLNCFLFVFLSTNFVQSSQIFRQSITRPINKKMFHALLICRPFVHNTQTNLTVKPLNRT